MYVDQLMYWVSITSWVDSGGTIEMSSLNGTGRVTLLSESEVHYSGITLYNNFLYISDPSRRLAFFMYSVSQKSSPLKRFTVFSLLVNLCN